MAIYKGNQKQSKVYKGGTKIGKIYKGSTLVYQSGPQIQLYGYTNNGSDTDGNGMIGGMSTSYPYYHAINNSSKLFPRTIKSITGTLGSSGSTILVPRSTSYDITVTYNKQVTINGIKLYFYIGDAYYYFGIWVMEGSVVGSTVLPCDLCNNKNFGFPNSCNSSSMTHYFAGSTITDSRASKYDKIWTLNGLI